MRKINEAGLNLIKGFEGFSSKPYPDPATGAKPITIGFGSTSYEDGREITMQDSPISKDRALELLEFEINQKSSSIEKLIKLPINDNEFAALVSFAYNCGIGNLSKSTLLKLFNAGADKNAIADQFLRWNRAAGKEMPGLTRRRQAERALFLQPVAVSNSDLPDGPSDEEINKKLKSLEDEILKKIL